MQFPGYWVSQDNGKVVIQATTFDETELDPQSDWREAWQNRDPESESKGFVEVDRTIAHAAGLIARQQGLQLTEADIAGLQNAPGLFKDGRCEVDSLETLLQLSALFNSLPGMRLPVNPSDRPNLPEALEEIPFN